MKYLKIQNDGVLDTRLIALMGGTTKANDVFKIGQWGSGLKYTLAYLLKNNIDFKIFAGEEQVIVGTETEIIRDEVFEIITINGQRTSVTVNMGGNAWEAWTVIREVWCNALDEGGALKQTTTEVTGLAGTTTFYIQITEEIKNVILNWSKYFIHDHEALFESDTYRIYPGGDSLRLYKQGVLIHESNSKFAGLFSYDIRNADINELREFKGSIELELYKALKDANEKVIRQFIENVTDDHYEGQADFSGWSFMGKFGKQWAETIGNATLIHQEAVDQIKARDLDVDLTASVVVPKKVYKLLSNQFKGVGALRMADKNNEFFQTHDQELEKMIKQGLAILETCDYSISPELSFIYGIFGDKRKLASVNLDEKVIYVSESMRNSSLFEIVGMLIEENEHFNTGFQDHTREFQQHFINLFTKTLLRKHEITL